MTPPLFDDAFAEIALPEKEWANLYEGDRLLASGQAIFGRDRLSGTWWTTDAGTLGLDPLPQANLKMSCASGKLSLASFRQGPTSHETFLFEVAPQQ